MANTIFEPQTASKVVLEALRLSSILPRTVCQEVEEDFAEGRGATVNVRGPVTTTAHVYGQAERTADAAIQYSDLTQAWVPVTLDKQIYSAVKLPDLWATTNLDSLADKVFIPQAKAVVEQIATPLTDEMQKTKAVKADGSAGLVDKTNTAALKFGANPDDAIGTIVKLRTVLNKRKVPQANRILAVGSDIADIIQRVPNLNRANENGDGDALHEAIILRLKGFTIVEALDLPDKMAVAYEKYAYASVVRAPRVPEGAPYGVNLVQDGYGLRHVMGYDPSRLRDQSVVDAFSAAATLSEGRAVAISLA